MAKGISRVEKRDWVIDPSPEAPLLEEVDPLSVAEDPNAALPVADCLQWLNSKWRHRSLRCFSKVKSF